MRGLLGIALQLVLGLLAFASTVIPTESSYNDVASQLSDLYASNGTRHTNNWAVLVCASRYWFNYRHMANTLAMYRTIKRLGIPDSQIILMLADDVACNARNAFPATVYANSGRQMDLYGDGIEVDYRGYEVTVEGFLRLLTGRHEPHIPPSKRLLTDPSSNVFVYMTGHGGNEFLKFQDNEEVSAFDIADAIEQMWEKRRYNKLLYVVDTCQANTMYSKFYSPNIISTGSSAIGENSYSHHNDLDIGVAVIDSFTHYILQYLETLGKSSKATLQDFFNTYDAGRIKSHPGISTELSPVSPEDILVTDFFGGVASVEVLGAEAKLPVRSLSPSSGVKWEEVSRDRTIGTGMREQWEKMERDSSSPRDQSMLSSPGSTLASGWADAARRERGNGTNGGNLVGIAVVAGIAGLVIWSFITLPQPEEDQLRKAKPA